MLQFGHPQNGSPNLQSLMEFYNTWCVGWWWNHANLVAHRFHSLYTCVWKHLVAEDRWLTLQGLNDPWKSHQAVRSVLLLNAWSKKNCAIKGGGQEMATNMWIFITFTTVQAFRPHTIFYCLIFPWISLLFV